MRQLRTIQAAGDAAGLPVSVCGEMASDPVGAVLLLGLGYRTLSVSPPAIPLVKWVIRSVPASAARAAADAALEATDAAGVTGAIRDGIGQHVDLRVVSPL